MIWSIFKRNQKEEGQGIEVYLLDAFESFENGNYEEASQRFGVISGAFPEHPIAHLMLGRCYVELNVYSQAIMAFLQHLRIYPDSTEALIYLGLTYYECGEYQRAEERFEEALALGRDSELIRENLAVVRLEAGEIEAAIDDLVALHNKHPNDKQILETLILAFGRGGKWDAAKQYAGKLGMAVNPD